MWPGDRWWVLGRDGTVTWRDHVTRDALDWYNTDTLLRDTLQHARLGELRLGAEGICPRDAVRWKEGSQWPVALLVSGVQKAIRRCKVSSALHLVAQVVRQGVGAFQELLRCLPLVCIEDAVPHTDLPFAVWLMAAMAVGFPVQRAHLERIGSFVADLAACPWRFPQHKASLEEMRNQRWPRRDLPMACMVRFCYGGANADMRLLRGVPWRLLVEPCPRLEHPLSLTRILEETPVLPRRHRLLEAVDFHCAPNMVRDIQRDLPHLGHPKKNIREALWRGRSAVTHKTIYMTRLPLPRARDPILVALYESMADYVIDYSRAFWERGAPAVASVPLYQATIDDFWG